MTRQLYWGSGSPYAWRAQLGLAFKGLEYDSKLLSFSEGDHRSDAYKQLNPRGKVPTLVDGDVTVYESLAVLAYLDRKYPDPPLFGRTPAETALIWRLCAEHENYLQPAGQKAATAVYFGRNVEAGQEAVETFRKEMQRVDRRLADDKWIAGEIVSAVDLLTYPVVQTGLRMASKDDAAKIGFEFAPLREHYPNVARWKDDFDAQPGVEGTYPPHWK